MAGVTSRPSRTSTRPPPTQPSGSVGKSGAPGGRLQAFLTGPEPRWARPALMIVVAATLLVAAIAAVMSLASGVEPRAFSQHASDASTEGVEATSIAQSFRSPRNNLSRVDLEGGILGPLPADGTVRLLQGDGPGGTLVHEAPLATLPVVGGQALSLMFPPIADSGGVTYTVVLDTPGAPLSSVISLSYNSFDALSSGALYFGHRTQAGDLAMAAYYQYDLATLVGDMANALTRDGWLLLCWLLVLMLPGLTMLMWLPNRLSLGQRIIAGPCMSALALPVFYLLMRAIGIRLGDITIWALILLCALSLVLGLWLNKSPAKAPASQTQTNPKSKIQNPKSEDLAFWGLFAGVLLVTLISRLLSLRDVYAGAGIDAYHHTLISEMFVQSGGIPSDYAPYAPLASFTYHFGFHALTATVGWLSGHAGAADMMTLMPLAGQIADTLPVLALTLFGWRALGNRWAGLAAGTLAGVVSVLPAFYVNWSRYTQGLGLALLPVALVLLLDALNFRLWILDPSLRSRASFGLKRASSNAVVEGTTSTDGTQIQNPNAQRAPEIQNPISWQTASQQSGPFMLAVVAAVGLALTHYRIIIIYATFALLYLAWRLFASIRARQSLADALTPIWRATVIGVLSLLALLPWLINWRQNFTTNLVNRDPSSTGAYYDLNITLGPDLLNHWGLALMTLLALGGVGWCYKRRDPLPLLPLAAWLILLLWSTPYGFSALLNRYWFWMAGLALMGGWALTVLKRKPIALLPGIAMLLIPLWPGLYPFNFRLPYSGYLDATTLVQGLWLPLSLPAGYTLAELGRWVLGLSSTYGARIRRAWCVYAGGAVAFSVLAGGLALGFALSVMLDVKPYIAQADANALSWISGHLRRDAYVLANPFAFEWDQKDNPRPSVHGSDAGLWVPLFAPGVRSSVPPLPAYNERKSDPKYLDKLREVVAYEPFRERAADWAKLRQAGITHIYIGSRGGAIYVPRLLESPEVRQVFHEDAVWIFELK